MVFTIDTPIHQSTLSAQHKKALATGNINSFAELLVVPLSDVARRCKISAQDAKIIYDTLLKHCPTTELTVLNDLEEPLDEMFSTGDSVLDQALGGGIRTGMLWEIVGESSAGKTQVALQLSLAVQNPLDMGGLSGSTCYLTTSAKLPTSRLKQLSTTHPALSPSVSLNNIHTLSISTVPILDNILTNLLPNFITSKQSSPNPIKLVVIDALTELFHSADRTNRDTIVSRSKDIHRIASALHLIASTHNVAVVVLNEVIDRFERGIPLPPPPPRPAPSGGPKPSSSSSSKAKVEVTDLVYSDKSRWFNTCDSIPGENAKEASLGLAWANQLNARIMLTRTGRRRYLELADIALANNGSKKVRVGHSAEPRAPAQPPTTDEAEPQSTLIRRLSVIFSSVAPPVSLDYIVTAAGVQVLPDETLLEELKLQTCAFENQSNETPTPTPGPKPSQPLPQSQTKPIEDEEDEWDQFWENEPDLSAHFEDFDALELRLTRAS